MILMDPCPSSSRLLPDNLEEIRQRPHLEVYKTYSVLVGENGVVDAVFLEGEPSRESQLRQATIRRTLGDGFLDDRIRMAESPDKLVECELLLASSQKEALQFVVDAINAQNGRALVDILVLQLAVKTICPAQDVRLHKSRKWREGIALRSLDDAFIVPTLRRMGLLGLNKYGAFMTRSFAENYPYTIFYKADIQGARELWLNLIDLLESGELNSEAALIYILHLLRKASDQFALLVDEVVRQFSVWKATFPRQLPDAVRIIEKHIDVSNSPARLLEIALHSLMQALYGLGVDINGTLKPLMPMRTANLKHGNIGDVEILRGDQIIEAWDAKYGIQYLGDDVDELETKLQERVVSDLLFGYVVYPAPRLFEDVTLKIASLESDYGMDIKLFSFGEWVAYQSTRATQLDVSGDELTNAWLDAYVESLGQLRREQAPIDEPTSVWLQTLGPLLSNLDSR